MDDVLVNAFLNQQNIENRVGGTFRTHTVDCIVSEMKEKFSDKLIDKERVHKRMKNIKRQFSKWYDIFQNGLSGFAWIPKTEMFHTEDEVWEQLIKANPVAAELKKKHVRNYEKSVQLYGKDRATGKNSDAPIDIRRKTAQNVRNKRGNPDSMTIDEIDQMMSNNAYTLETFTKCEVEGDYEDSPTPNTPTSQAQYEALISRTKRLKQISRDDALDVLKNGFNDIATAIKDLSTKPPVTGSELWELISSLGLKANVETKTYMALLRDRDMLTGFTSFPPERRKEFLLEMIFGGNSGQH